VSKRSILFLVLLLQGVVMPPVAFGGEPPKVIETVSPDALKKEETTIHPEAISAKQFNDDAVHSFIVGDLAKTDELLGRALTMAKSDKNECLQATILRNQAAMYHSNRFQAYLENQTAKKVQPGGRGFSQDKIKLQLKIKEVTDRAWNDATYSACTKSAAMRITDYGIPQSDIDKFENFYQRLRDGVKRYDKQQVASLFDFPMEIRVYGIKKNNHRLKVRSKADFVRLYSLIIPRSARACLMETTPAELWSRDQGICVASGGLWLNQSMKDDSAKRGFVITTINSAPDK